MTSSFLSQRNAAEVMLFALRRLLDVYELLGIALRDAVALAEHLALGGDPDERRGKYLQKKHQQ